MQTMTESDSTDPISRHARLGPVEHRAPVHLAVHQEPKFALQHMGVPDRLPGCDALTVPVDTRLFAR